MNKKLVGILVSMLVIIVIVPITATANEPPSAPEILEAPDEGLVGYNYSFKIVSTDPDGDRIKYGLAWNWDDLVMPKWTGITFPSGEPQIFNHSWDSPGYYDVRFKAKDSPYNAVSDWSEIHTIHVIKIQPEIEIGNITGGRAIVSAEITNAGMENITTDINWNLTVQGGIFGFINKSASGNFTGLQKGKTVTVSTENAGRIFGFGKVKILVTAQTEYSEVATKSADAFVLLWFIFIPGEY